MTPQRGGGWALAGAGNQFTAGQQKGHLATHSVTHSHSHTHTHRWTWTVTTTTAIAAAATTSTTITG